MFRFKVSEKHLCFIPALLLASQVFYRIFYLQTAGCKEITVFAVLPTLLAALTIGIFFQRNLNSAYSRFVLHTILLILLVSSILIPPTLLNGAELIITGILAGLLFARTPDRKGAGIMILLGLSAAGLLFAPEQKITRYMNFILLPFAQFCLTTACFVPILPQKRKFFTAIPLFLFLMMVTMVSWVLLTTPVKSVPEKTFQNMHRGKTVQLEQYLYTTLALIAQEKREDDTPVSITVVEHAPMAVTRTLHALKERGLNAQINHLFPDFTANSQRLLPVMQPIGITPAEIPDFMKSPDLMIIVLPMPSERSAAFMSSATFYEQVMDNLPENGILAVYTGGTETQIKTIFNSMPVAAKKKDGTMSAGTVCFPVETTNLLICRKNGRKLLTDGDQLVKNLPEKIAKDPALAKSCEAVQFIFPTLQKYDWTPDEKQANRPFHPRLLQLRHPPAQGKFFHFVAGLHLWLLAFLVGIYFMLRYIISWKPVHKPCFQGFEAGFLTMILLAVVLIAGSAMGCGPLFSLVPWVVTAFGLTFLFLETIAARKNDAKYECIPLVLVVCLFLLSWNLITGFAMVAAMMFRVFLKREIPDLPRNLRIYPRIWMLTGMLTALVLACLFLILPF